MKWNVRLKLVSMIGMIVISTQGVMGKSASSRRLEMGSAMLDALMTSVGMMMEIVGSPCLSVRSVRLC